MNKVLAVLSAVAVLGAAATSQAATIDFTSTATKAAVGSGKSSVTINDAAGTDVDVTVTSAGSGATITWNPGDGLGVSSWADPWHSGDSFIPDDWEKVNDEINQNESLTIGFSEGVTLQSIGLTDLYASPTSGWWSWVPDEAGTWVLKDPAGNVVASGAFEGVEQRNPDGSSSPTKNPTNGVLSVDLEDVIASAITLASSIGGIEGHYKGFSVGSVTFEKVKTVSVPELSASGMANAGFLLVGAAMLLTGAKRRKLA